MSDERDEEVTGHSTDQVYEADGSAANRDETLDDGPTEGGEDALDEVEDLLPDNVPSEDSSTLP